jgi:hypothetical protein
MFLKRPITGLFFILNAITINGEWSPLTDGSFTIFSWHFLTYSLTYVTGFIIIFVERRRRIEGVDFSAALFILFGGSITFSYKLLLGSILASVCNWSVGDSNDGDLVSMGVEAF